MPKFTGFDTLADEEGFIVAYPDATNRHWNDTRGLSPADDVAFVRALVDELSRTYLVDPNRVYATGISNGGFFVQRLACDLTDKIAAVASVAATMPENLLPQCKPSRPISVLFMQGTNDPLVHSEGGIVGRNHGRNTSLDVASKFWRDYDQTSAHSVSEALPDVDPRDGTRVHLDIYTGGKKGTEVVVYTIQGGGHTWPGGSQYLPRLLVGHVSQDINATSEIWRFFDRQPRPPARAILLMSHRTELHTGRDAPHRRRDRTIWGRSIVRCRSAERRLRHV